MAIFKFGHNTYSYNNSVFSEFRGRGRIVGSGAGIVTKAGTPARALVMLVGYIANHPTTVLAATLSTPAGEYEFSGLNEDKRYAVVAFDADRQFNAVIRDNITPAPMP